MSKTSAIPATIPTLILEPVAQALADALAAAGVPPLYTLSAPEARAVLEQVQAGELVMRRGSAFGGPDDLARKERGTSSIEIELVN